MENTNMNLEINEQNLYKYSDIDLVNFIKDNNSEDKLLDNESKNKDEFLIELAIFLEKKLKNSIKSHQEVFKIYKQKLLAEKTFVKNSIKKEIRSLTINQFIDLLKKIKNDNEEEKFNKYFNIGKKINNPLKTSSKKEYINDNKLNDNFKSNQLDDLNNIFSGLNQNNNENTMKNNPFLVNDKNIVSTIKINNEKNVNFQDKFRNNGRNYLIFGLPANEVYHSPAPIFINKIDSKIIKENENVSNQINFNEEQKIFNNKSNI
jgi:hypothetical protein